MYFVLNFILYVVFFNPILFIIVSFVVFHFFYFYSLFVGLNPPTQPTIWSSECTSTHPKTGPMFQLLPQAYWPDPPWPCSRPTGLLCIASLLHGFCSMLYAKIHAQVPLNPNAAPFVFLSHFHYRVYTSWNERSNQKQRQSLDIVCERHREVYGWKYRCIYFLEE